MIRDHLIPAIKIAFPEKGFRFSEPPAPIASLASPCAALGVLEICDDGDEATVYLTGATHSHFGAHDDALSEEDREKQIVGDVIEFLKALFADCVVLWCVAGGLAGGWRILSPGEDLPKRSCICRKFVWSRELK